MNATLLVIATILSGIIVFMKNDEKTSTAATHAAMTIDTGHLASVLTWTTAIAILPLHPRRLKATAGGRNPVGGSPWTNMTATGSRDCFTITRQALQRALVEAA